MAVLWGTKSVICSNPVALSPIFPYAWVGIEGDESTGVLK